MGPVCAAEGEKRATNGRPYEFYCSSGGERRGGHCPPDNPSVSFADTSLYTREAIRCGGDEGR